MAQRKGTSRGRRRQAAKAPVIDLEAKEVAEENTSAAAEDTKSTSQVVDAPTGEAEPATESKDEGEGKEKGEGEDTNTAEAAPESTSQPTPEESEGRGRGKLIAAGVAALLLAGAAGGAWLYRDLGADYFPPAASQVQAEQMAALQSKVNDLTASNTAASTALKTLTTEIEALKKQVQTVSETISAQSKSVDAATAKAAEALALAQQADGKATGATEAAEDVKSASGKATDIAQNALDASRKAEAELKTAQTGIDELKSAIAAAAATASSVTGDASETAKAAQAQISGLTLKLAELESKLAQPASSKPDPAVTDKITGLETALAALRTEVSKVVEDAKANIDRAAKSTEAQSNRDGLVQALNRLSSDAAAGKPFAAALAVLKPTLSDTSAFQALSEVAATGVPDEKTVLKAFAEVHGKLSQGEVSDQPKSENAESASLLSSLQNRLSSVIKIRPSGSQDWTKIADAMAAQAKEGQLAEMVQTASEASDAPPEILAAWLKSAKARVTLDQNVSALSVRAMEQLAQTSKTGG